MKLRWLLAVMALVIVVWNGNTWSKTGMVKTTDGRTLEGDITDKGAEGVAVRTKVGSVTIARAEVASITYFDSIEEAYKQRVAQLPKPPAVKDHLELARWLYDVRAYDLARVEVGKAMILDPNSADADNLRKAIERTAMIERTKPPVTPEVRPPETRPVVQPAPRDRKLLDADQINIIRQWELKTTDRVNVRFVGDVKKRFTDYDNRDPRVFSALTPMDQTLVILQRGTEEMRKDVRIASDPQALADYKRAVQGVILQGCASANCHSTPKAGKFLLVTPANNDEAAYTNFYILTQYAASIDGAKRKAIERLYPENSLILQYGLPRDRAEFDHPDVPNWIPIFKNLQDTRYRQITEWIRGSLVTVEPKYGIDFALPGGDAPATRPADAPKAPAPAAQPAANSTPAREQKDQDRRASTVDKLNEARDRLRPGGGFGL